MQKGFLDKTLKYSLIDKKDHHVVISDLTCTSAFTDYLTLYHYAENKNKSGTAFLLRATIPRIAGSDYFVDNCGDIEEKTVIVPAGNAIHLTSGFSLNPRTGAYQMADKYELKEC